MSAYRYNRRNCSCDDRRSPTSANHNRSDIYADEPPVRDVNSIYKARNHESVEHNLKREISEKDSFVQRQNGIPPAPLPKSPIGPPPMGRYDLWDLRFDRWWGWYWVRRQQQQQQESNPVITPVMNVPQNTYQGCPSACCKDCCWSFGKMCKRLCCFNSSCCNSPCCNSSCLSPACCETKAYPNVDPKLVQKMYDTPSNSCVARDVPQMERSSFYPAESLEPVNVQIQKDHLYDEYYYPDKKPRREIQREAEKQCQSWVKEKFSSSSSEECPCTTVNMKHQSCSDDCLQYLSSRLQQLNPNKCCQCLDENLINSLCCNVTCCPCQHNICCTCTQNLLMQKQEKPKRPKRKKKTCVCATQTVQNVEDKNVSTAPLHNIDACVCCKPKQKIKSPNIPCQKICCLCHRLNVCPTVCRPCIIPTMCMCCPGGSWIKTKKNETNSGNSENGKENQENISIKDSESSVVGKVSKKTSDMKCSTQTCPKRNLKVNDKTELSNNELKTSTNGEVNVFNSELLNHLGNHDWLQDFYKYKDFKSKTLPSTDNWLNDFLSKPTLHKWPKLFQDNRYLSPLTGNMYNTNLLKINDFEKSNYEFLEPMKPRNSIEEIKAAASLVEGDMEHRNLLTSVCDAILSNQNNYDSTKGGDSSYINEYTYPSFFDPTITQSALNSSNSIPYCSYKTKKNFTSFTQTDDIINKIFTSDEICPKTIDEASQNVIVDNKFFTTSYTLTDPINKLFNEKINTEIDTLFNKYLEKMKHPKLSFNPKDENCQAKIENEDISAQTDSSSPCQQVLKNAFVQYDETNRTNNSLYQTGMSKRDTINTKQNFDTKIPLLKFPLENNKELNTEVTEFNTQNMVDFESDSIQLSIEEAQKENSNRNIKSENCDHMKNEKMPRRFGSGVLVNHRCSMEVDVTKLPIRSPRNKKLLSSVNPPSLNYLNNKQLKRPASSIIANTKKKKISEQLSLKNDPNSIKKKMKSKIPVKCSDKKTIKKFIDKNSESTLHLYEKLGILLEENRENYDNSNTTETSKIEDIFVSSKFNNDEERPPSRNSDSIGRSGLRKFKLHDEKLVDNTSNTSENFHSAVSKEEIMIASIKYDSNDNLPSTAPHIAQDDTFRLEEFSFPLPVDKSVLSIIKEETESDINITKSSLSLNRCVDSNTSPFNFELDRFNYVDSCNSPFEMRKTKGRSPLALLCFSSHERDSEPYCYSSGNESSSSSTSTKADTEKPKTKERRWFRHN